SRLTWCYSLVFPRCLLPLFSFTTLFLSPSPHPPSLPSFPTRRSSDLETKAFSKVLEIENENIDDLKWDKRNNLFYFITTKGVTDKLYSYDLNTGELKGVTIPVDTISQVHVAKTGNLYLLGTRATMPPNIFKLPRNEEWNKLTNNGVLGIEEKEMVDPEVVSYESFDGMEIEALLFKAKPEYDN